MKHLNFVLAAAVILAAVLQSGCSSTPKPPETIAQDVQRAQSPDGLLTIPLDEKKGIQSTARNTVLVFDSSGSMDESLSCSNDSRFSSKIAAAKWAVSSYLAKLPKNENVGLIVFDGNARRAVPLGPGNHDRVNQEVQSLKPGAGTPLNEALYLAVEDLKAQYQAQLGYGDFRIVIITDGEATDGSVDPTMTTVRRYGIFPVYTIGLCVGENHALRRYSKSYKDAQSAEELKTALEDTLAESESYTSKGFSGK